jgi:hypothetical protein
MVGPFKKAQGGYTCVGSYLQAYKMDRVQANIHSNLGQGGRVHVILKRAIMRIEIIAIVCDLYLSLHVINPSSKLDN